MISIALIGSASIGFVWGWTVGDLITRVRRPLFDGSVIGGSTLIMVAEIFFQVNGLELAFFLSTTSISALLHIWWRREMYKKFGPPDTSLRGDLS